MKRIFIVTILTILSFTTYAQQYLLIGVDSRNPDLAERSNADMIMIMDISDKGLKLMSVMRDMYVNIPGKGMNKLNAAYRLGKQDLLIKTLNSNLKLQLKNYVVVDFINAPIAIDSLDGIMINVDEGERVMINKYVTEQNIYNKKKYPLLTKTGDVMLNGGQSLAYCRIRTDGDRERTGRQKEVFNSVIKRVNDNPDLQKLAALTKLFKTDMPYELILSVGSKVVEKGFRRKLGMKEISVYPKQATFPLPESSKNARVNGMWVVVADLVKTRAQMTSFLKN